MGFGINASGEVTGIGDTADFTEGIRSFRASPGLPAQKLPSLGGSFVFALGINDAGQVAGAADLPGTGVQHTIVVDADGTLHQFAGLNGSTTSGGTAIDNAGRVVGQASVDADGATQHAFKATVRSSSDLDGFGSSLSSAEGIADGTTVGFYTLADDTRRTRSSTRTRTAWSISTRGSPTTRVDAVESAREQHVGQIVGDGLPERTPARVPADAAGGAAATTASATTAATATSR